MTRKTTHAVTALLAAASITLAGCTDNDPDQAAEERFNGQPVGDWDGDGHVDVITRSAGTCNVGLHRGSGDGLLAARTQ